MENEGTAPTQPQEMPIEVAIANLIGNALAQVAQAHKVPVSVYLSMNAGGEFMQILTVGNRIANTHGKMNFGNVIVPGAADVAALSKRNGLKIADQ